MSVHGDGSAAAKRALAVTVSCILGIVVPVVINVRVFCTGDEKFDGGCGAPMLHAVAGVAVMAPTWFLGALLGATIAPQLAKAAGAWAIFLLIGTGVQVLWYVLPDTSIWSANAFGVLALSIAAGVSHHVGRKHKTG